MSAMARRKAIILNLLNKALLKGGEMDHGLYEYELEEHLDVWYEGLKADHEDYVFIVTENSGHVAMVLISRNKTVFVNESAREKLSELWLLNYKNNLKFMLPILAGDIDDGFFGVTGVREVDTSKKRWVKSKGFGK
jgi:hypothetical protein